MKSLLIGLVIGFGVIILIDACMGTELSRFKKKLKRAHPSYVENGEGFGIVLSEDAVYAYIYKEKLQVVKTFNNYTASQVVMQLRAKKAEYRIVVKKGDSSIYVFWQTPLYAPIIIQTKNSNYEMDSLRDTRSVQFPVLPGLRYTGRWILFPTRGNNMVCRDYTEYIISTSGSDLSQTFKW